MNLDEIKAGCPLAVAAFGTFCAMAAKSDQWPEINLTTKVVAATALFQHSLPAACWGSARKQELQWRSLGEGAQEVVAQIFGDSATLADVARKAANAVNGNPESALLKA